MTSPTNDRNLPHQDPTDLRIRRLQQKLRAAETLCDLAWDEGYKAAERTLHVPDELITALRHGSAHEHAHIPIDDQLVAIVLARPGTGRPCPVEETHIWGELQRIHREATTQAPAAECMLRWELPPAIGAMVWRAHGHVIVVRGRGWHRRCLTRALHCHRGAWALVPLAGAAAARAAGRVVHSTVSGVTMAAAVSVTAVTAIGTTPWQGNDPTLRGDHQVRQVVPAVPSASSSPARHPKKTPSPTVSATGVDQDPSPVPSMSAVPDLPATSSPAPSKSAAVSATAAVPVDAGDGKPSASSPVKPPLPVAASASGRRRRGRSHGRALGRSRYLGKRVGALVPERVAGVG